MIDATNKNEELDKYLLAILLSYANVAQLFRVSGFHPEGPRLESEYSHNKVDI